MSRAHPQQAPLTEVVAVPTNRSMRWLWLVGALGWGTLAHAQVLGDLRRTPIVQAVERATPAVVTVRVEVQAASPFTMFGAESRASEGSGVILDASGVVLTNAHVVDGARRIHIHLADGRTLRADLVAADPELDLAVLRVVGGGSLPAAIVGDSDELLLGEPVVAIGNPYGLGLTVSTGVVASTARDVNVGNGPRQTYIQTDAAINPGNSGGALVNVYGELIGINTFIHSGAEGIGFAIPVNRARKIAEDLLTFGSVQVPWLGVTLADRARGGQEARGVVVARVWSPGIAGNLRPGDVIEALDGHVVASRADVNARLAAGRPGTPVAVRLVREGQASTVSVRALVPPSKLDAATLFAALGAELQAVEGGLLLKALHPNGSLARAGLRPGDLVFGVDGQRLGAVDDLGAAVLRAWARHRNTAWLTVLRGQVQGSVAVQL